MVGMLKCVGAVAAAVALHSIRRKRSVCYKMPDVQGVQKMLVYLSLAIGHRVQPITGNHNMESRRAGTLERISYGYA